MSVAQRIPYWLGITSPKWMHQEIAHRNMPLIAVGSVSAVLYAIMLAFYLFSGTPSPLEGFDEAAYASEQSTLLFKFWVVATIVVMLGCFAFAIVYRKKNLVRPGLATLVTFVFAYVLVMVWVVACSGQDPERQILFFASMQFLVAGLIVFNPVVSLAYFGVSYLMFGTLMNMNGLMTQRMSGDLIYLAFLDVLISMVVYGLFVRANEREHDLAAISTRDELTGAKNRHALRDDFEGYYGVELFVMLCDIDDFKRFNDDYDHTVGDDLLRQFFFALREGFGDECVYRYGGDEFLIVSHEFGNEEFERKVKKVADQLAKIEVEGRAGQLTYSGGYTCGIAPDNEGFRAMLHHADENLLAAKGRGKNQLVGEHFEA